MVDFKKIQSYYSQDYVKKSILDVTKDREVAGIYKDGRFGKRPDILQYPADIEQAVRDGVISFHGSVERWKHPMKLKSGMTKNQLDEIRKGWDVLIDVDVPDFEIAKIFVKQTIVAVTDHGVSNYGLKYTGGKSFHIIIPFESLPSKINMEPIRTQYPEAMEKIIEYIQWYTKEPLIDELISFGTPSEIAERVGKDFADIAGEDGIDPYKVVDMDIFGSRHLFRLPYAIHEKSLRISMPLKVRELDKFEKKDADIENAKKGANFISKPKINDAEGLVVEAFDWASKHKKRKIEFTSKPKKRRKKVKKILEDDFPPCVKDILNGISDGRKRSVFILINFLRNMGWKEEEIEKRLHKWNENNYPPLGRNYIRSQMRWHSNQNRNLLPPSCDNDNFYKSFDVCKPDEICKGNTGKITVKNPINYAFRKMKREGRIKSSKKSKSKKRRKKYYR